MCLRQSIALDLGDSSLNALHQLHRTDRLRLKLRRARIRACWRHERVPALPCCGGARPVSAALFAPASLQKAEERALAVRVKTV